MNNTLILQAPIDLRRIEKDICLAFVYPSGVSAAQQILDHLEQYEDEVECQCEHEFCEHQSFVKPTKETCEALCSCLATRLGNAVSFNHSDYLGGKQMPLVRIEQYLRELWKSDACSQIASWLSSIR